ncbi:MAG: hypothetical protein CME17_06395 [Gemmatimonadetes bacterium]|nr:hypothetical protein [Gemmatimonadota bacterium]
MTDNDWIIQYEQLKSWAESKNYTVTEKWGVEDCIVFEDQEIFINSRCKPENMFYTLLHECGHYLLDKAKESFKETHPVYPSEVTDGRIEKSTAYRVCILSEELKAWERGWRLAKRLNLHVDQQNYHRCMTDALWTYVIDVTKDIKTQVITTDPNGSESDSSKGEV